MTEERVLLPITEGDMFPGEQQVVAEINALKEDVQVLRRLHGDNIPTDKNHMHACLKDDEKLVMLGPDIVERVETLEETSHTHPSLCIVSQAEKTPDPEPDIERLAEVAERAWRVSSGVKGWHDVSRAILKELGHEREGLFIYYDEDCIYWLSGPGFLINLEMHLRGPIVKDAVYAVSKAGPPSEPDNNK